MSTPKNIWIVDDSPTILASVSGVLQTAGHDPKTFLRPHGILGELRAAGPPHLIITDLNMPEMDGISLIREIRKIPTCRFVPILMLTTESQQEKRSEAKAAGATGWLVKPVSAESLQGVLQKVLPA